MTDREALRAQLIRHEKEVLHVYQDSLGFWTLGVGRLVDKRRGGGISHLEAMFMLDNDIDRNVTDLVHRYTWFEGLDAVRQRAVVDLSFNLGPEGLLEFQRFLRAMGRREYATAAGELVASKWHTQVGQRALTIEHMVRTGTEPDGPRAA